MDPFGNLEIIYFQTFISLSWRWRRFANTAGASLNAVVHNRNDQSDVWRHNRKWLRKQPHPGSRPRLENADPHGWVQPETISHSAETCWSMRTPKSLTPTSQKMKDVCTKKRHFICLTNYITCRIEPCYHERFCNKSEGSCKINLTPFITDHPCFQWQWGKKVFERKFSHLEITEGSDIFILFECSNAYLPQSISSPQSNIVVMGGLLLLEVVGVPPWHLYCLHRGSW